VSELKPQLDSQPRPQLKTEPRRTHGQEGYTLVGLLIVVAVVNIALAVAVTSWRTLDTRAREAELIWRGEQIARAIACHGATEASEPLEKLEQLVESSCLRRVYRDPMSRDGEWRILRQADVTDGTIAALQGQPLPGADDATASAGTRLQLSATIDRPSLQGGLSAGGTTGGVGSANTIVGVMSQKKGAATRVYRTYDKYESWLFLGNQNGP